MHVCIKLEETEVWERLGSFPKVAQLVQGGAGM